MKKNFKVFFFAAIAAIGMISCDNGPKPLTSAEIEKKVADMTAEKTKAATTKLDQECEANMEAMTNAAVESILTAKRAAATAK